jgi:biotin synthase
MDFIKKWPEQSLAGELPAVDELTAALKASGPDLELLYEFADQTRSEYIGDEVHVRGIIEFSNICQKNCNYCGIRADNESPERYRMDPGEIIQTALRAKHFGYGTVVLQSGEPAPYTPERMFSLIEEIKNKTDLAITLSIGVYPAETYREFRRAGADRYLLRFETSDREKFAELHPDEDFETRLKALEDIRRAELQTGSGFMIGLPGASIEDIARDIIFTTRLDLDMIGCGPFVAAPNTPLAGQNELLADKEIYFKTIAILRLLNPRVHIPATTAYDSLFENGRNRILKSGGNVFMPNLTPARYRSSYQLYPNKPCVDEHADQCAGCVKARLASLNRPLATGPGHSLKK